MSHDFSKETLQDTLESVERSLGDSMQVLAVWHLEMFGDAAQDYIRKEVERKLYEPELPNGGDRERRIIERLKKLLKKNLSMSDEVRASQAIKLWAKVLPEDPRNSGWYYVRRPLLPSKSKIEYEAIVELRRGAVADKNWEKKWFYDLLLDGLPEPVANFELECTFLLKRSDGTVSRMVRLRNVVGETTGMVSMDAEAFHAPQKFRKFCLEQGNFTWGAGEKEIQKLHNDIARLAAWRVVNEVVAIGWLPLSVRRSPVEVEADGLWFFGDTVRANADDDQWLKMDADRIYWHRREVSGEMVEEGYQLGEEGREAAYCHAKPLMHVGTKLTTVSLKLAACPELDYKGQDGVSKADLLTEPDYELKLLRCFFREMNLRLAKNVGSLDANFIIGAFLAYAAAPELFARYSLFPGLWVHGEAESGKSTICEWMMEIWGFTLQHGLFLRGKSVSAVGLLQGADQFSNLPVWCDEYRNGQVDEDKASVLHNGFNRAGQFKFNPSRVQRTMRTNFIVSGESTSNDAAMRGRFPHVQISSRLRQGTAEEQRENFQWFHTHRKFFFFIGRHVMEHRREFVKQVFQNLEAWDKEEVNARLKIVHGVGYAAWMAMVALLQSHSGEEVTAFRKHMVEHSQLAGEDVQSELNVNVFIQDLITAWKAGALPHHCFRVKANSEPHAPDAPGQAGGWIAYDLYVDPDSTISALAIYLTKQRGGIVLKRKDLRDQLSKNIYWIKPPPGKSYLNKRFGRPGDKAVVPSWGIKVDLHPLGYKKASDEEYEQFLLHPSEGDPRKGPLFALVEGVYQKQMEEEREAETFQGARPA